MVGWTGKQNTLEGSHNSVAGLTAANGFFDTDED